MRKKSNFDYDFSDMGRRIQIRRKELGLTQEQLAEKVDCSLTHLSRIEGGSRPSLESLIRISTLLGYSLDDLTGLYPAKNPYLKELCDLFLQHSTEEQQMALHAMRHFFHLLDQIKARVKQKEPLSYSSVSSEKVTEETCAKP
ncbi:MAG: helix-turn-helix transcriptional regulator [Lachnospiraceae bacterium]|jgi:transcriptional regulator with XRE-family HTH domain|nr:helix-turn-helix transcriptional regulator [Lachnospiraceae bacterium]